MIARQTILDAMKADMIPSASSGHWTVNRIIVDKFRQKCLEVRAKKIVPIGTYTNLWCSNMRTLMRASDEFPGENVMNDTPGELAKHLEFIMRARGRVLVTGLGLGCVVRGLLAKGRHCREIHVVERSEHVIKLCGASVADPRVTIHQMDARQELPPGRFDFAWHDLFSADDEPHLQVIHLELIAKLAERVAMQGAWAMRRQDRRAFRKYAGVI